MSYFGNEKELADKEREEAEVVASNEYQKELDEGLPHIERLADGSWVGSIEVDMLESIDEIENQKQRLLEAILEQKEKDTTDTSFYVCEARGYPDLETNKKMLIVKLKKVEEPNE